jgi:hypothetical protein
MLGLLGPCGVLVRATLPCPRQLDVESTLSRTPPDREFAETAQQTRGNFGKGETHQPPTRQEQLDEACRAAVARDSPAVMEGHVGVVAAR